MAVEGFVGDIFETVDFGTLSLSETAVFGLLKVVERKGAVADFRRDVVDDDIVDVAVFDVVVVSFDVAVVLVAGLDTVLKLEITKLNHRVTFPNITCCFSVPNVHCVLNKIWCTV